METEEDEETEEIEQVGDKEGLAEEIEGTEQAEDPVIDPPAAETRPERASSPPLRTYVGIDDPSLPTDPSPLESGEEVETEAVEAVLDELESMNGEHQATEVQDD
jgi:hypothetical protein